MQRLWQHAGRDVRPHTDAMVCLHTNQNPQRRNRPWNLYAFSTRNAFASRVLISKLSRSNNSAGANTREHEGGKTGPESTFHRRCTVGASQRWTWPHPNPAQGILVSLEGGILRHDGAEETWPRRTGPTSLKTLALSSSILSSLSTISFSLCCAISLLNACPIFVCSAGQTRSTSAGGQSDFQRVSARSAQQAMTRFQRLV